MSDASITKHNVLYLEDDPAQLPVEFSRLPELLPIRLTAVSSVKDAQAILHTGHFDLFVLDIEMAGERSTGIQLAEQIRQHPSYAKTPILFTSMHTHYSQWLFSSIRHCSFLPKPFTEEALLNEMGVALGIEQYVKKQYVSPQLMWPVVKNTHMEIDPLAVSYIEITNRRSFIQYIDGRTMHLKSPSGILKQVLDQIENGPIPCLRQIYRSIIINVNQIKSIELEKNVAYVWLFNETKPLPMGMSFRNNLREFF